MRLTTLCIGRWGISAPMEGSLLAEGDRPLVQILLKIFLTQSFLPPKLPLNDWLRQADSAAFSLVRVCNSFFVLPIPR